MSDSHEPGWSATNTTTEQSAGAAASQIVVPKPHLTTKLAQPPQPQENQQSICLALAESPTIIQGGCAPIGSDGFAQPAQPQQLLVEPPRRGILKANVAHPEAAGLRSSGRDHHTVESEQGKDSLPGNIGDSSKKDSLHARLYEVIIRTSRESENPSEGFIPEERIVHIIDEALVERELRRKAPHRRSIFGSDHAYSHGRLQEIAREICGENKGIPSKMSPEDHGRLTMPPRFRKIFAILVLIQKQGRIEEFLAEGVCDSDLPLIRGSLGQFGDKFNLCRRTAPDRPLKCFLKWGHRRVQDFEQKQWRLVPGSFLPPKPDPDCIPHFQFDPLVVLPFTSWRSLGWPSASAQVFKATIHSDYHRFGFGQCPDRKDIFAVKRLYTENEDDFRREVRILRRLSRERQRHPHLMPLLATYEQRRRHPEQQGERFHLVFELAGADLDSYWTNINPKPGTDFQTSSWLVKQCQGIADGLARIHWYETGSGSSLLSSDCSSESERGLKVMEPSGLGVVGSDEGNPGFQPNSRDDGLTSLVLHGRHCDIKPENILWFPGSDKESRGTLKIADFGDTMFTSISATAVADIDVFRYTSTYLAPELDKRVRDGMVSSLCDVWSLGCVFLEFVTWRLGGAKAVQDFSQQTHPPKRPDSRPDDWRTDVFYELDMDEDTAQCSRPRVKAAVREHIQELHSHPHCSQLFHDLLTVIEKGMLVADVRNQLLNDAVTSLRPQRMTAGQVSLRLGEIHNKCDQDSGYVCRPRPRLN